MSRYNALFEKLDTKSEGAFVPFVMLGDPTPELSFEIIDTLIQAGADALELGVPFSDSIADGPAIQASHIRALDAGVNVDSAFSVAKRVREKYPDIPMGLLVYGNVVFSRTLDGFYEQVAAAGIDSVLVPDVPVREGKIFAESAKKAGVAPIFIAPPHADKKTLEGVAHMSEGYIYGVSRVGVTGVEHESSTDGLLDVVNNIRSFGGAPLILGFGISKPQHVKDAVGAGAKGAISGSAITKIISKHVDESTENFDKTKLLDELHTFVSKMKEAAK